MLKSFGLCFSKELEGDNPLGHIGSKRPVYLKLLDLCLRRGWKVYVLTRQTYQDGGFFKGGWEYHRGRFTLVKKRLNPDLIYDRTGGVAFPPEGMIIPVVNDRNFKLLCWDKLATYGEIGRYMPATFWVGKYENFTRVLPQIKGAWVVLKPYDGLKGLGIYIGPKEKAGTFKPPEGKKYLAQEFVDTSGGVEGITPGLHDIRIVIVNHRPVWCHVRVPAKGSFTANAARGGTLTEIDYDQVPEAVKRVVGKVTKVFRNKYGNPIYSLDFGIGKDGQAYIFEINDQIGFPKEEMRTTDLFLEALVKNFREKLL